MVLVRIEWCGHQRPVLSRSETLGNGTKAAKGKPKVSPDVARDRGGYSSLRLRPIKPMDPTTNLKAWAR